MLWDLCWVEEGWAVGAQAGQEGPGSPGAVFTGAAQPQPPQIRTGPLPETQGRNQLRSQGGLCFTAAPLFDNHRRNCNTETREARCCENIHMDFVLFQDNHTCNSNKDGSVTLRYRTHNALQHLNGTQPSLLILFTPGFGKSKYCLW